MLEGLWPWIGVGLAAAAAVAGYHFFLIRDRSPDGCFKAFNHNTWFGFAVFVGVFLAVMIQRRIRGWSGSRPGATAAFDSSTDVQCFR